VWLIGARADSRSGPDTSEMPGRQPTSLVILIFLLV
jgi:hypothetical protein